MSHDIRIKAFLKLRSEVTLSQVAEAFKPFLVEHDVRVKLDGLSTHGELEFVNEFDNELVVREDGGLVFCITGNASCQDILAAETRELADKLCKLVSDHGVIEHVDDNVSGDSDGALVPLFVGSTEAERLRAQVEYALDAARYDLLAAIGDEGFIAVQAAALTQVEKRIAAESIG